MRQIYFESGPTFEAVAISIGTLERRSHGWVLEATSKPSEGLSEPLQRYTVNFLSEGGAYVLLANGWQRLCGTHRPNSTAALEAALALVIAVLYSVPTPNKVGT